MALAPSALEFTRGSPHRASFPLVEEDRGGGSRRPTRRASDGAFDNLHGPRDPPPLPAPTRGVGCANAIDSTKMQQALVRRPVENLGVAGNRPPLGWDRNLRPKGLREKGRTIDGAALSPARMTSAGQSTEFRTRRVVAWTHRPRLFLPPDAQAGRPSLEGRPAKQI